MVVLFLAFPKFPADGKNLIKMIFDQLILKGQFVQCQINPMEELEVYKMGHLRNFFCCCCLISFKTNTGRKKTAQNKKGPFLIGFVSVKIASFMIIWIHIN